MSTLITEAQLVGEHVVLTHTPYGWSVEAKESLNVFTAWSSLPKWSPLPDMPTEEANKILTVLDEVFASGWNGAVQLVRIPEEL